MIIKIIVTALRQSAFAKLFLVLLIALTFIFWHYSFAWYEQKTGTQFSLHVDDTKNSIQQRITAHLEILNGAGGLFAASKSVNRAEWKHYVEALHLERFPDLQGIGFIRYVSQAEKESFERQVRGDNSIEPGGYPGFAIFPPGERKAYYPVEYFESLTPSLNVMGLDHGAYSVGREALERARDLGTPTASDRLISSVDMGNMPRFMILLPVYRNGFSHTTIGERRVALLGFVYARFVVNELIANAVGATLSQELNFEVYDGGFKGNVIAAQNRSHLLYSSADNNIPGVLSHSRLSTLSMMSIAGRDWVFHFSSYPGSSLEKQETLFWLIMLGAPLLSFAVFLIILIFSTERKRVNNEMERQNSLISQVLDTLPINVFLKDEDGRFVMINAHFARLIGMPKDEVIGMYDSDIFSPDVVTNLRVHDEEARAAGSNVVMREERLQIGGKELFALAGKNMIPLSGAVKSLLLGFSIDITERKKAEIDLRESKMRLRSIIDNSNAVIHAKDMEGRYILANRAHAKLVGIENKEIVGKTVYDCFPKELADSLLEHDRKVFAEGKAVEFEEQVQQGDGLHTYISVKFPLRNSSGEPYAICGISNDITEYMRLEREAVKAQANQFSRALTDAVGEGLIGVDIYHRVVFSNPRTQRLLGIDEATILGKKLDDVVRAATTNGELLTDGTCPAWKKISKEEIFQTEDWSFERADGRRFPVSALITPILENGHLTGSVLSFQDITLRKQAETTIQRYKQVVETSIDGFWLTDLQLNLLDTNEAYSRMSGYTIDELKKMNVIQLEAGEQPDDVAAHRAKIITKGYDRFESKHLRKDGQIIDVEVSVKFISESQQFFVFSRDITESKHAENALRVAAVAFETHDAILITDQHSNIVRVNQAFTDITGYSKEEVLGQNPRIMSSGRHDKAFFIEMWQQLLHTGTWAGEILDKRKDGRVYPKWLTITAVKNNRQDTTHYVSIFSDITARKQAEEEIRNLAFYDSLTQLPNRRLFMDRFRAALTISTRRNDYGAVLFIDLDRFKTLNDTLGHDYGDLLLIQVAARTKSCVREMDTVARLGGDEFVVLIEGVSEDQDETSRKVGLIAEKIRETLAHPYKLNSHEHHCSPSIGISLYRGNDKSVDEVIQQADMAMYQAKECGRNAVRFFDPVMQHNVTTRASLQNDLHNAIALDQLQLHYQVQVDNKHHPVGAEALLRWVHPVRGLVMPNQFIPVAEESTLILDIGHWVLNQACAQLALWTGDEHMCDLTLAVNVSAKQFAQPKLVHDISEAVKLHQISPSSLKLELTESMLLHDLNNTIDTMHALKKLGVKLSMDDFGTGYSSLSYLRDLPLDQIKIDQSFVQNITRDGNDAMLVQTIIDLGGNFHMNVIAEGVETEGQLTFLKHHDCLNYQGYLFSKPVPIDEFERLVNSRRASDGAI